MSSQTTLLNFGDAAPAADAKATEGNGTKSVVAYINLSLLDKHGKAHSLTDRKVKQYASVALSGDSAVVQAILAKKKSFNSEDEFNAWLAKAILISFQEVTPKGEIEL